MNVEFSRRALREILREARWWAENRPDAPLLFEQELKEAIEKIRSAPEASRVFRVKRGRVTRRVLMKTSKCHVYYRLENPNLVLVQCVWGALRGKQPKP